MDDLASGICTALLVLRNLKLSYVYFSIYLVFTSQKTVLFHYEEN